MNKRLSQLAALAMAGFSSVGAVGLTAHSCGSPSPTHFGSLGPQPTGTGVPVVHGGQFDPAVQSGVTYQVMSVLPDGGYAFAYPIVNCSADLDGGCLDGGPIYVVGWDNVPLSASDYGSPASQATPYFSGGFWHAAAITFSGDTTCTVSANVFTCTAKSATGTGTNEFDAGGAVFNMTATEECIDTGSTSFWCASRGFVTFTDATTWQTIFQRTVNVNETLHEFLTVCIDDYSGDGGSSTKNFGCAQIQVHAANDTIETLIVPAGGSDVGPGPMTVGSAGSTVLSGCTANNSDAGCTPSSNFSTLFSARTQVSGGVIQTQLQGTGLTHFSWKGRVLGQILRSNP